MVDVTVSIVHASGPEFTLDCLESLALDTSCRASIEIVVLDNASGDDMARRISTGFPGVRVIAQRFRAGFGANHNTVIRATESRDVLVLNPDTQVPPGMIDGLVDYLESHPAAAVVGPLNRDFSGRALLSAVELPSIRVQLVWALTLGQRGAPMSAGSTPQRVGAVGGCAMLISREALERIGLFDESYFMYCEEADLAQRLRRIGREHHYVPTVEVLHHGLQSTAHVPERRINEFWRSFDVYLGTYHSRVEARILRWLTGMGYAFAVVAAAVGSLVPERLLPASAASWDPKAYRLHVRNAFISDRGPGLRELAEDWNRARGVGPNE